MLKFHLFSFSLLQCLGQNYAYNEASFFLIRLLQHFDSISLAPEAQPAGSLPPPEWRAGPGRQAYERIWPAAAITLFIKVRATARTMLPRRHDANNACVFLQGGLWVRFHKAR
jgi:hypothetical protein